MNGALAQSMSGPKAGNLIRIDVGACVEPRLHRHDRGAGAERADGDDSLGTFLLEFSQHRLKCAAREGRVKVKDCADGQIRLGRILVDERDAVEMQAPGALARACDVGFFGFDSDTLCAGKDRGEDGDVP